MKIELRNIWKAYAKEPLFSNVSVVFESGTMSALTGRSGAGKTTLLNCVSLLEKVDGGSIFYDLKDVTILSYQRRNVLYRKTLSFIF
jgi:putative ABC transport system ATP-binding protein